MSISQLLNHLRRFIPQRFVSRVPINCDVETEEEEDQSQWTTGKEGRVGGREVPLDLRTIPRVELCSSKIKDLSNTKQKHSASLKVRTSMPLGKSSSARTSTFLGL